MRITKLQVERAVMRLGVEKKKVDKEIAAIKTNLGKVLGIS